MNPHLVRLIIGMVLSVVQLVLIFYDRRHTWANWAKRVSIAVCGLGLIWSGLGLALHYHPMSPDNFNLLYRVKQLLGGICVGMLLTILIARPWQRSDPQAKGEAAA